MKNKIDLDAVIAFRRQGFLFDEIAQRLNCKPSQIKRICISKRYQKRSQEWIGDSKQAMDTAFNHYATVCAKNSVMLLEKALEVVDSESPRIQVEGLKIAYQMIKDSRNLVISDRITGIEEILAEMDDGGDR